MLRKLVRRPLNKAERMTSAFHRSEVMLWPQRPPIDIIFGGEKTKTHNSLTPVVKPKIKKQLSKKSFYYGRRY
jgi:hypothetical protein